MITWSTPWSIAYGTALGSGQLNANSSVPGTFTYDPPAGTILDAGDDQVLSLNFVPDDPEAYNSVSSFVTIDVDKNYLVVRADDQSMREGEMVPELTLSYSGFMNGEGPEVLDSPPSSMPARR